MAGLTCASGHANSLDLQKCATCGLPLVDYNKEVGFLLERLKTRLTSAEYSVEKIFIGAGSNGKRILYAFSSATLRTPGVVYLTFNAPEEKGTGKEKSPSGPSRDYIFKDYPPGGSLYAGVGRRAAMADPGAEHFLKQADISQEIGYQNVLLVAALGGGTGSGVGPYIIHKVKQINPTAHTFAVAITPSRAETEQYHFNAYCGVSSLLHFEDKPNTDVIVIINYDELRREASVGPAGEELRLDGLTIILMQMLALDVGHAGATRLARLSQGLGIQAYVPCLGTGRSMEIFGSLTNVLESAFLLPMAPIDKANVMAAYLLIRIPRRLDDVLSDQVVNEEFDKWAKGKFPTLKASMCLITRLDEPSDRVSVCVLLGGDSLDNALQYTKTGYLRFREYLSKSGQMGKTGLDSNEVDAVAADIERYNSSVAYWRSL